MKSILHYFIETYFPDNISFEKENFDNLRLFLKLNKYSKRTTELVLKDIINEAITKELEINIIHDCIDNSVKGLILPEISAGILFENMSFDNENYIKAKELFASAKKIHDEIEKIYIPNTDFEKLDVMNRKMAQQLFDSLSIENIYNNRIPLEVNRFFGAMTVKSSKNYIENLTENMSKRYFIKGRAGTGKSTFMKKLAATALEKGCNVEKYHCSFDASSVDMIIIRELKVCIFDSTAPHELFPNKDSDYIIDIYSECVKAGTDEKYEEEISYLQSMYDTVLIEAKGYLSDFYKKIEEDNKKMLENEKFNYYEITNAFLRLMKSV